MSCTNCGKTNRLDSRFCRFCGASFDMAASSPATFSFSLSKLSNLNQIFSKLLQNKRVLLLIAVVIISGAGSVFAAPKISDFVAVNKLIKKAAELESQNNYKDSVAALILTEEK